MVQRGNGPPLLGRFWVPGKPERAGESCRLREFFERGSRPEAAQVAARGLLRTRRRALRGVRRREVVENADIHHVHEVHTKGD